MTSEQRKDPWIESLILYLSDPSASPLSRALCRQASNFVLRDGVLYRRSYQSNEHKWLRVITRQLCATNAPLPTRILNAHTLVCSKVTPDYALGFIGKACTPLCKSTFNFAQTVGAASLALATPLHQCHAHRAHLTGLEQTYTDSCHTVLPEVAELLRL